MTEKEAPPGGRAPQSDGRRRRGERKAALANPEKSGGAKFLGCGVDLTAGQGALCQQDCKRQTVGNRRTQRLDLPHGSATETPRSAW